MSDLLNQLDDENLDFTVEITDESGKKGKYDFLDIVCYEGHEYAVVAEKGSELVEIFLIGEGGGKETYTAVTDEETLENVFEIFKIKNEDEFDF